MPFAASSYHKRRGAVYCIFSGVWEEKSINERGTPGEKRFFDQKRVNAGGLFYTKTLSFEKNRKSNDFHEISKFSNPLLENKGEESNQFDWGYSERIFENEKSRPQAESAYRGNKIFFVV